MSRNRLLGERHIPRRASWWMQRAAQAGGLGALALLVVLAYREGVPESTYFDPWERPAQMGLLAVAALGYLAALRWPGVGGAVMMQAGVGLGVLASMEYQWLTSLTACLAFFVPGLLFVLTWQRTQTVRGVTAVFAAVAVLLAAGWYASSQVYSYYLGPTHPESPLERQPVHLVEWMWAGGVTTDGVTVTARLKHEHTSVRLVIATSPDLTDAVRSAPLPASADSYRIVSFTAGDLEPDTRYYYTLEADGVLENTRRGTFQTFPDGQASFSFAFSGCARTGSNGAVFDTIREQQPLLYLVTGDLHYQDIGEDDPGAFVSAYQRVLTSPAQQALYASTPVAYVWDDHDYGPNNADSTSPSRPAARSAYRLAVPHYDLPAGDGGAIYQAFSAGRVRFIITDTRSERSPASQRDDANKTMLGDRQKEWFKRELLAARDSAALIVWLNPDPWIGAARPGGDGWDGYDAERQELAAFITENGIKNILMISGDAHMTAIDDGSNSPGGFPVFHAGALDRRGSIKGGPYSEGVSAGGGQFGLVTVNDNGDTVQVVLSGRNYKNQQVVGYEFTVSAEG